MGKPIKFTDKNKAWNKKKPLETPYSIETQFKLKTFLIICEGKNTEPDYFKSFPVASATIESYGLGSSKKALVWQIIEIVRNLSKDPDREVWCVFDMDVNYDEVANQHEDFDNAIELADSYGFKVAYSNDCFELWFVLHYQLIVGQLHRQQYYEILSKIWNCNYEKEGKKSVFSKKIYQKLETDEKANMIEAMKHSKHLLETHEGCSNSQKNPCTTVFKLVCELCQLIPNHPLSSFCKES